MIYIFHALEEDGKGRGRRGEKEERGRERGEVQEEKERREVNYRKGR